MTTLNKKKGPKDRKKEQSNKVPSLFGSLNLFRGATLKKRRVGGKLGFKGHLTDSGIDAEELKNEDEYEEDNDEEFNLFEQGEKDDDEEEFVEVNQKIDDEIEELDGADIAVNEDDMVLFYTCIKRHFLNK